MDKISVILSWPDGFDFPLFRKTLPLLQEQVHEVIICFTQHGHHSLKEWLRSNLPGCVLLDSSMYQANQYGGDWRNKSTNLMIDYSTGDYILSLEPDFFIKDYPHFFNTVKNSKTEIVGYRETNRLHPAFLLVKKDIVLKTSREFSVLGTGVDHFAYFSGQIMDHPYTTLEELGLIEKKDWFHMRGLTDNVFSAKPYYDLPNFYAYNKACMELDIPISDQYKVEMVRFNQDYIYQTNDIENFV